MSCNHTMSLSRGVCVHCGMPDPSLSTDLITQPSSDLSDAMLGFTAGNEIELPSVGECVLGNIEYLEGHSFMRRMLDRISQDTLDQIDRQYNAMFLSTPGLKSGPLFEHVFVSGRRNGKSLMAQDAINQHLANLVQVGGMRRDHVMVTWPVEQKDYTIEAWPEDLEYREHRFFDDVYGKPVGENPCRDLCLTYEETYDGAAWREWQKHMDLWKEIIMQPMPRKSVHEMLMDISLVDHPIVADASFNLKGAKVEITGSRFDHNTRELFVDVAITPPKPVKMLKFPIGFDSEPGFMSRNNRFYAECSIDNPFDKVVEDANRELLKAMGGGVCADLATGATHTYAESLVSNAYLSQGTTGWVEMDLGGPVTVKSGALGEVQGVDFVHPNVTIREVDVSRRPMPSFQQWWDNSVNGMPNQSSPGVSVGEVSESYVAPTLPVTGPTIDDYRHMLGELVAMNPFAEVALPPNYDTVEPRKANEGQPFNQESVDWYTAVADQMLDECERDGEDQGTTILRLTNALDRELDTQAKMVRAAYKKVGMFCIDIERDDERLSLVIERKGWWH